MKKTMTKTNPNFYKYQELASKEFERHMELYTKTFDIKKDLNKLQILIYSEKHRRKYLDYTAKAMEALSTSAKTKKLKKEFEKLSKEFKELSNG